MYSGDEKGRNQKYSKITASSAQNSDFYCNQSSSAYYFKQCINEGCWYWLSFVIDHLTTAGDHHGDFNDFDDFGFWMVKFEFQIKIGAKSQKSLPSFSIHHGKHHLSCCY
jgi:hypothetical protein